jgi:hypothetical protein
MVLEAAINGDADALVTYNISDFAIAAVEIPPRAAASPSLKSQRPHP